MQRLKARNYVDQLALPPIAASDVHGLRDQLLIAPSSEIISKYWHQSKSLIFVGALAAVVRLISPFLGKKDNDPAILVMDSNAKHIVPLLGIHMAGADQIAAQIAEDFGGTVVFTSNMKNKELIALDSFGLDWGWDRSGNIEDWNKLVIGYSSGKTPAIKQSSGLELWKLNEEFIQNLSIEKNDISSGSPSLNIGVNQEDGCCWHPHNLWIGIGCERNTDKDLINRAIKEALQNSGLAPGSIAGLSSVDLKSDEPGLISLLKENSWHIRFFSSEKLSKVLVPNPSNRVNQEIGTHSVAEASALLAAGEGGELLLEKNIFSSKDNENGAVTIAIAKSLQSFAPHRGELHLVGSGPGDISFLTNDARYALSKCVIWIGYKFYLDLLEPLRRKDQIRVDSQLTEEKSRCIEALNLANQGAKVALISSGDSGIYGMAGLALELLLKESKSERPNFDVHPGISAVQMAAAKSGAPLTSDFCVISLSDLLMPWEKIQEHLLLAAQSDFVVAIYNPRSIGRDWQLKRAIEIFLEKRLASTPILFARQLGRIEEQTQIYRLDSLPLEKVDMLTVLVVGNSKTFAKDGFLLTPRGYSLGIN